MHAKYEVSASNGSKVIANVKVDNRQTDKQTDKQTGQKQYAPDHSIRGHKNTTFQVLKTFLKTLLEKTNGRQWRRKLQMTPIARKSARK